MYNHAYQLTHDLDCFFVLNGCQTHLASNGGIIHPKIGTVAELREMQSQVANMQGSHKFKLNTAYLSTLDAADFPNPQEIARLADESELSLFDNSFFSESEYAEIPFSQKLYSNSFVEMARKGFWSFDRVGTMPNGIDAYILVAWPDNTETSNNVIIGHQFYLNTFENYLYYGVSNCFWSLMEMISMAEQI